MELKKITAIVRRDQLDELEQRLKGPDVPGMTIDHVNGYGEYVNFAARDWLSRYSRIEIVAEERQARRIVDVISGIVHTGTRGDGIIYLTPVQQLYRIRDRHVSRSSAMCPLCRAALRLRRRHRRRGAAV